LFEKQGGSFTAGKTVSSFSAKLKNGKPHQEQSQAAERTAKPFAGEFEPLVQFPGFLPWR
jgi:hypothetical protein